MRFATTDGNLSALEAHLAEIEAYEASQEPCPICDETDCDCAENNEAERGEYLGRLQNDE